MGFECQENLSISSELVLWYSFTMAPKISVIIPTHNRAGTLSRAIKSVLNQTFTDFELIVIDDGSTDGTPAILDSFPNIIRMTQKHSGVSRARNCGIAHATGEWVSFLDSDDEWLPKKLGAQIEFLEENPDIKIVQTEEVWIRNGKRVNSMKKHKKHSGFIFKECLPLCIVSPSAVVIKRELLDEVGYFDETFPACEDYDLWLRIAAGHPIGLIDRPLIIKYGGHEDQLSRTIPSLDLYRIKSIEKILNSGILTTEQTAWAQKEFAEKCTIYGNGCLKRGKISEGEKFLSLSHRFKTEKRTAVIH